MVRFSERAKNSSPLENFKTGHVVYAASYSMDTESSAAEVNLVTQSASTECMNDWRCTSNPHTCLCGVDRVPVHIHVGLLLSITLLDMTASNTR